MSEREYKIPGGPTLTINVGGIVPPDRAEWDRLHPLVVDWARRARERIDREIMPPSVRVDLPADLGTFGRDDVAFSVRASFDAAAVAMFNHDPQKEQETMPKHQDMTEQQPTQDPFSPPAGYVWWEGEIGDIVPMNAKWAAGGELSSSTVPRGRALDSIEWTRRGRVAGLMSATAGIVVPIKAELVGNALAVSLGYESDAVEHADVMPEAGYRFLRVGEEAGESAEFWTGRGWMSRSGGGTIALHAGHCVHRVKEEPAKSYAQMDAEIRASIAPKPERSFRDPVIAAAWGVNVEPEEEKPLESFDLTVNLGESVWIGQCMERNDGCWDVRATRNHQRIGRYFVTCDRPDRYSLVREIQMCTAIESGDMTDGIRPDPVTDRDTLTIYGPDDSEAP